MERLPAIEAPVALYQIADPSVTLAPLQPGRHQIKNLRNFGRRFLDAAGMMVRVLDFGKFRNPSFPEPSNGQLSLAGTETAALTLAP
ncbi:MAG: hypothetical protein ACK5L2_21340, partial [Planctomyces sp.]